MKEQLLQELNKYKTILNIETIEYLKSLIELEISILKEESISYDSMKLLMQLEFYQKLANYNIYQRSLNLFQKEAEKIHLNIHNDKITNLYIKCYNENISVFDYQYRNNQSNINLYELINSPERRQKEINDILQKLEKLYNEKNPFSSRNTTNRELSITWHLEHRSEIDNLEQYLEQLKKRAEMNKKEKYQSQMQQYFTNKFLEDCEINPNTLKEITDNKRSSSHLTKKLVKEYPNITLTKNITYY